MTARVWLRPKRPVPLIAKQSRALPQIAPFVERPKLQAALAPQKTGLLDSLSARDCDL